MWFLFIQDFPKVETANNGDAIKESEAAEEL